MSEYVLGTSERELARLELQQRVWGPATQRFFDALAIRAGATVVDLGCGPGLTLPSLAARVGPSGRVIAVDESPVWMEHLRRTLPELELANVELVLGRIQDFEPADASCDLVFSRWVLSFLPGVEALIVRLARALKPGGALAIQDYNHEGVSLFPESEGFRAAVRATRALYASKGGDPWLAARLPHAFARAGLELCEFRPTVLCGGIDSPVFAWADAFFPHHVPAMAAAGFMSPAEEQRFHAEWAERKRDPRTVFFSPIVVDAAARKRRG